jgi:hypothetical protein
MSSASTVGRFVGHAAVNTFDKFRLASEDWINILGGIRFGFAVAVRTQASVYNREEN